MKKLLEIVFLGLLLSGCTVSDTQMKPTSTSTGIKLDSKIKEIIFLNNHKINSKLTIELINRGIKVKPFASQQKITKKKDDTEIEYKEASSRYALKVILLPSMLFILKSGLSFFISGINIEDNVKYIAGV